MARPRNRSAYEVSDAAALAGSYSYGIARNHPFVDGNKRTAAVVSETFLILNGYTLETTDAELVVAFLELAAGNLAKTNWQTGSDNASSPPELDAGRRMRHLTPR